MRFSKEHIIKAQKKAKLIYDLFSKGKYQKDDIIYSYVLPEKYWVNIDDETGTPVIVFTETMKLYATMKSIVFLDDPSPVEIEYRYLWNDAKRRVKEKFESFNIEIVF